MAEERSLFPLHELLEAVRSELAEMVSENRKLYAKGTPPDVRFDVLGVELEASVVVQETFGGSGKIEGGIPKVLVIGVGAHKDLGEQQIHKIKITLGAPEFKVGADEKGAPVYGSMPVTARDVEEGDDAGEYGSSNLSGRR
jgi:hypothetical protein